MSTTIDEKVVEMRFDNRQFEQNVQTSLSTLDKLKQSLNLEGAAKGFERIDAAAGKCDFSMLTKSIGAVQTKFSALEVVAMTALSNITNSAVNTGKRMASALTIEPIKSGFQEYETQIGAVQTILANTQHEGTNLQQVNRALDELNTYADKTIYNFTEMTRNIGTFTAAGVDLQTSVNSIKGIANLAAVSGSTSQQASTAMYQLSQALAAGKVSLMDWNSVVNAGMGGKVFQDALVRTSELLGTGAQSAISMYGSFRESLTKGEWLTTEVLTETLKQFAGAYSEADLIQQGFSESQAKEIAQMAQTAEDAATKVKTFSQLWDTLQESAQSGWTETWEILVGDFDEAKELLTEVSDTIGGIIGESAQARNELLSGGLSSGWKQLLNQGIADEAGYIEQIQEVTRKNGDAFDKMVADSDDFSDALKKGLTEGVISSKTLSEAIHNLRDKMTGMSQEERNAAGYTSEMIEQIEQLDAGLRNGSISMEEFTGKILEPSGRENLIQSLWNAAKGLISVITPVKDAFRDIFPPTTSDQVYSLTEKLLDFSERLTISNETANNLERTFKGLFAILDLVKQAFSGAYTAIKPLLSGFGLLGGNVLSVTASFGDWLVALDSAAKKGEVFSKIGEKIATVLSAVVSAFTGCKDEISGNFDTPGFTLFHSLIEKIGGRLTSLQNGVKSFFGILDEAASGSAGLNAVQTVWNGVSTLGNGIITALTTVVKSLADALSGASFSGIIDLINALSLGTLALSVKDFGSFSDAIKEFLSPLDAVKEIGENAANILNNALDSFKAYQEQLKAGTLLKIASAIAVLVGALAVLSTIDSAKLGASLAGISVLLIELTACMEYITNNIGKAKGLMKTSSAMILMSTSILILASAMKTLGELDWGGIAQGLVGVAGLMAVLTTSSKSLAKSGAVKGAANLILLATALKVMASACESFGTMDTGNLVQGITAISVVMAAFAGFTKYAGNASGMAGIGTGLLLVAASMKVMASAIKDLGSQDPAVLAIGLTAIGAALAELAIALNKMPESGVAKTGAGLILVGAGLKVVASAMKQLGSLSLEELVKSLTSMGLVLAELAVGLNAMNGTLGGSAALLVASGALVLLASALTSLGDVSWEGVAKGLILIAGSFAAFAVGGAVLTPVIPTIIAFSAALSGLLLALTAFMASLSAFNITASMAALASPFQAFADAMSITFLKSLAKLIPDFIIGIIRSIGEGIVAFCEVITNGATSIGEAVKAVILTLADVVKECVPAIADAALALASGVLDALVTYAPGIIDSLFDFLIEVLNGLAERTPELITAVLGVLDSFFSSLADALSQSDPDAFIKLITSVGLVAGVIAALNAVSGMIPGAMGALLGVGAFIAELALILTAFGALAQIPGLTWLVGEGGALLESIGNAIGGFVGGIIGGVASGITSQLPQIGTDLANFMTNLQPFFDGAGNVPPGLLESVGAIAGAILLLAGADVITALTSWIAGEDSFESFTNQLVPFGEAMAGFSNAISGMDAELVTNAANAGKALAELATSLPNSGGVLGFFAGENDMDAFAAQLVPFGKAMAEFSEQVKGVDAEAVTASATAGKALTELAATVPNCGGLFSLFTGDNSLSEFGDNLVDFGASMAEYYAAIADIKPEVVTASANAAQALSTMASGLPDISLFDQWFGGNQTLVSFGEDMVSFGESIGDYYAQVSGIDTAKLSAVIAQIRSLASLSQDVSGIQNGGLAGFGETLTVFTRELEDFVLSVNVTLTSLDDTVDTGIGTITATIRSNLTEAADAVRSYQSKFTSAGKDVGQGFINGIRSKISGSSAAGRSLGLAALTAARKALDSHSPSKEFVKVGESVGQGLENGIKSSTVSSSSVVTNALNKVVAAGADGVDNLKNTLSGTEKAATTATVASQKTQTAATKSSQKEQAAVTKASYSERTEVAEDYYQSVVDWIEEEKYYNRMSTQQELAEYEKLQQRYKEGSEERKKIDREVYSLKNQLMDESYENSMNWIEQEEYYGRLSLAKELAAYKSVQSRYATGTEERKKMDKEVYRVEKEIYEAQQQYISDVQSVQQSANEKRIQLEEEYAEKVKSINEELEQNIESLNEQYENSVKSRANSLYSAYGLFDEVSEKDEVSSDTLMENLEDQVKEFGEWQDILSQLSAKGVDSDLISELQEMGPSAIAQIKALNSMSDDELDKYVSLWSVKHAQAREQATSELEYLRIETQEQIVQLRNDAYEELEDYRDTWQEEMDQLKEDTNAQLKELRQSFAENVGLIKKNTESELQEMTEVSMKIMTEAGWDETGKLIVTGLTQGVAEQKSSFLDELTNMALAGVEAVKSTLEIKSPSRVFQRLGNYTGLGFINGLADYADKSYVAGADMADSATNGLSNAMSVISDLLSGDIDSQPSIRPVLDLSDITSGVNELDSLFYPQHSIGLVGQASLAFNSAAETADAPITVDNNDVVKELRSLRSEMSEMVERMERMQVVMDTGALVGAMADPMDTALGQKQSYRGRGI